jgi:hypothetical protein
MLTRDTEAGLLTIARAGSADYDAVLAILREAADWLSARGNPPWNHWYMDVGERILRERLENHEVYLFERDSSPVCGELLISPESAIRHTHDRRRPPAYGPQHPRNDPKNRTAPPLWSAQEQALDIR